MNEDALNMPQKHPPVLSLYSIGGFLMKKIAKALDKSRGMCYSIFRRSSKYRLFLRLLF